MRPSGRRGRTIDTVLTKKCRNPLSSRAAGEAKLAWPERACVNRLRCFSFPSFVPAKFPERVMSHRLRPLRLIVLSCAAAAMAGPLAAQQPATPPAAQPPAAQPPAPGAQAPGP
jgi:hypothetical protein